MIKTPISLQDLRRSLYVKAKAESTWRFWGLYVHVCKMETLREAYQMARKNNGAPGIDGVTFEAIEESGVENVSAADTGRTCHQHVSAHTGSEKRDPEGRGNKVRVLSIPSIRDRVVQGAVKLILEPIFEADFQPGSYGYRPRRTAHQSGQPGGTSDCGAERPASSIFICGPTLTTCGMINCWRKWREESKMQR